MLIVIAEREELELVSQLGYDEYPILITGVGGMNVINALKDLPRDTEIMNIGYCGSIGFVKGKIVEITEVYTNHTKADFEERDNYLSYGEDYTPSICYTSTDFVEETKKNYCVFDMELAFIRAMFNNVRAIKVVSDNLSYKEYKELI